MKKPHRIIIAANKWRDAYNPLRALTLQRAIALQEAYNRGEMADLQWLYSHIEQADPDLLALIERRNSALLELDWNIKLIPEDRRHAAFDPTLAADQAAALRAEYERMENLYEAVEHLGMAAFRGFSVIEPQDNLFACFDHWNVVRDGYSGPWKFNPEATAASFDSLPAENLFDPDFCLIRTVRRRINYYALYKYIRSNLSAKDWDAFVEIFGLPGCIITLPENVPNDKVDEYKEAAEDVANGGSGALPAGSSVNFSSSAMGENPFRDHMKYLQEQLVLAGTGGLLTMLSMPQGIGSGSSEEHADAFETIARAEARRISEVFQKQFDRRLLRRLFPNLPVLAYFEIAAQESVDVGEIIDHAVKLSTAGYQVDPAELAEKTGYKITLKPAAPEFPPAAPHFVNRSVEGERPGEPSASVPTHPQTNKPTHSSSAIRAAAAAALGVDPAWLAPVADLLAEIERKAADDSLADSDLISFLESAAARLPELFDKMDHTALAETLESALGASALAGAKDAFARLKAKKRQDAP